MTRVSSPNPQRRWIKGVCMPILLATSRYKVIKWWTIRDEIRNDARRQTPKVKERRRLKAKTISSSEPFIKVIPTVELWFECRWWIPEECLATRISKLHSSIQCHLPSATQFKLAVCNIKLPLSAYKYVALHARETSLIEATFLSNERFFTSKPFGSLIRAESIEVLNRRAQRFVYQLLEDHSDRDSSRHYMIGAKDSCRPGVDIKIDQLAVNRLVPNVAPRGILGP